MAYAGMEAGDAANGHTFCIHGNTATSAVTMRVDDDAFEVAPALRLLTDAAALRVELDGHARVEAVAGGVDTGTDEPAIGKTLLMPTEWAHELHSCSVLRRVHSEHRCR